MQLNSLLEKKTAHTDFKYYGKISTDLSVEALVLRPEYESLYSNDERKLCTERIEQFGYIIDWNECYNGRGEVN